ncbi:MAG TPA: hypothetical protein VGS07_11810 [Thermoanaerobaculia bacterium]|jgi:hypothetical protein|nr:hypothetical protein [Thermoanaerobaculia bacterium]
MTLPNLDVSTVQLVSGRLVPILEAVSQLLQDLSAKLPASSEDELEGLRPYSLTTDLRGALDCAVNDHLTPAIKILTEMSRQTEEGAAQGWRSPDDATDDGREPDP